MALQTLKALWASGDKFPITTLTFNLTLGFKYNGQPWQGSSVENKILRYALSQSDVTLDGEVYSASCFSAALPERSDNTFQDLTFSIGDVNREILQYLSRITRNDHKNLNFVTLDRKFCGFSQHRISTKTLHGRKCTRYYLCFKLI